MWTHPASCAVTRLELFFFETSLGHATGFLYNNAGCLCLVSNWHVFSGKNAITLNVMNKDGMTPTRIEFHLTCAKVHDTGIEFDFVPMVADLTKDGVSLWWQHRGYLDGAGVPRIVDIGILPLAPYLSKIDPKTVQSFENQVIAHQSAKEDWTYEQGTARVGSEVFILGYPIGLAKQGVFPIWKRASIASEPLYPIVDTMPAIYVNLLTRHGMSGSPVILVGNGLIGENGLLVKRELEDDPWLIGVYAGRSGSTGEELEMALGRVWKKPCWMRFLGRRFPAAPIQPRRSDEVHALGDGFRLAAIRINGVLSKVPQKRPSAPVSEFLISAPH